MSATNPPPLQRGRNGYTLGTSKLIISLATYANDLAVITNNLQSIQTQLNKFDKYCEWAEMDLGVPKCAITGCPNKSNTKPNIFKGKIQAQNITYRNQPPPILRQNEPYVYLGISPSPPGIFKPLGRGGETLAFWLEQGEAKYVHILRSKDREKGFGGL